MSNPNAVGVVMLDTPDGPKAYRKLSARIPEFLRDYPVKDGFRVLVRQLDALSYQKGLLELYQAAIRAGKKPSEVGLPEVQSEAAMVFEAVLVDRSGETLATATAVQKICEFKDWERGETAARQRLLAALGYGGDVFDEDELATLKNIGVAGKQQHSAAANPEPANPQGLPAAADTQPQATAGTTATPISGEPAPQDKVTRTLLKQLERYARLRAVPVPKVRTVQEALEKIEELRNAGLPAQASS